MPQRYELIIPGRAVGKASIRVSAKIAKDGHAFVGRYFGDKSDNFIATVRQFAMAAQIPMLERCRIEIVICLPMTRKFTKKRGMEYFEPMVRPDEDNVSKSIKDALQGIAFANDKHVVERHVRYLFTYREQPETRIMIEEVDWRDYSELRGPPLEIAPQPTQTENDACKDQIRLI